MNNNREFADKGAMLSAFKTLRFFNEYVLFPLPEEELQNPILIEYFESPLDCPVERVVEKAIGTAAAHAVYDNPNIPSFNKRKCAEKTALEVRQAMRMAKLEYCATEKELPHIEYEKRKKAIPIVEKAVRVKKIKKFTKYFTLRGVAELVVGPAGGWAVTAGRFVWSLMPSRVRKSIQTEAREIKEKAFNTIRACKEAVRSTKVGQIVERAVEKAKPLIKKSVNVVKDTITAAKEFAKSFWPW